MERVSLNPLEDHVEKVLASSDISVLPVSKQSYTAGTATPVDRECKAQIDEQGRRLGNMTSAAVEVGVGGGAKKVCSRGVADS